MRPDPRGDDGTVLVLLLGLFAVLLVLVGVVVDVSVVVLAKRSLAGSADGAAISAAQALDEAAFYADGPDRGVPLSEAGVQARVDAYAEDAAALQPGLQLTATVDDGYTAQVTATRTIGLPFSGWLGVGGVALTATARASAPLVGP